MAFHPSDDVYNHNYDGFKSHCIGTVLKFVLFPRKCHITHQWIWLEYAYRQTAMWTGPGDPVFENRWYNRTEFLIERIKGKI